MSPTARGALGVAVLLVMVAATGCESTGHRASGAPTTAVASTTTLPDDSPLGQIAQLECKTIFDMVASPMTQQTVPIASEFQGSRYQGLYSALQVWNESPGAAFNAQYVQATCTKLGFWSP